MITGLPTGNRSKTAARKAINNFYLADEDACVSKLIAAASIPEKEKRSITRCAGRLIRAVRAKRHRKGGLDAFLHEYDLSSQEGIVLMCLAESLLRIPDKDTVDRLIQEKLGAGAWDDHLGHSASLFVNASTWGLMLTGRFVELESGLMRKPGIFLTSLVARVGQAMLRNAMIQAMRILAEQFIVGQDIEEACKKSVANRHHKFRYSFDMLGEAALCQRDADSYFASYAHAIAVLGESAARQERTCCADNISIKLTALHPRYEFSQRRRVLSELIPRVLELATQARQLGVTLTIDAEEADCLDLSLDIFEAVYRAPALAGWDGLGLAVQAYQKRALAVLDWLAILARSSGRQIPLRLVKGAYWDTEIKRAQVLGLENFPVFTRKTATDVSYLACTKRIFAAQEAFYPQFATHNAYTAAAVIHLAPSGTEFEFQRLQGMGEALYDEIGPLSKFAIPCRVYAPVGNHQTLLPYLARRLLENGANTSFVNRVVDDQVPAARLIRDPVERLRKMRSKRHPRISLPARLFGDERRNSAGLNLADRYIVDRLTAQMEKALASQHIAQPIIGGQHLSGPSRIIVSPADHRRIVGHVTETDTARVREAVRIAVEAYRGWSLTPVSERAACLDRAADLMEKNLAHLMALCVQEGGKTVPDALSEVREAVDYCRYYARLARKQMACAQQLAGPTGERNELFLRGRGAFVCISPWNFPLAIFVGQLSAALVCGNSVIAKPAVQTPLIAALAVELFYAAGIPASVLHYVPGRGPQTGSALVADQRIAGVAFTGSTATAWTIQTALARHHGPIVPLIAETGGQNAMIVDSSALPEQVVKDVLQSAFNSAGQRCSALRVLFLQDEIATTIIDLLSAAMDELKIGDPALLSTDIGPIIDDAARDRLLKHEQRMCQEARLLRKLELGHSTAHGCFYGPCLVEINRLDQLKEEVFGPVLHVLRFSASQLDQLVKAINQTGYGLTMGIQSRLSHTVERIYRHANSGNIYINRNMIGAVVGAQPFGGEGLSGTGPKAGGPHYLYGFTKERTLTSNISAIGGNADLLNLSDDEDIQSTQASRSGP